jgi:hypothetical protein
VRGDLGIVICGLPATGLSRLLEWLSYSVESLKVPTYLRRLAVAQIAACRERNSSAIQRPGELYRRTTVPCAEDIPVLEKRPSRKQVRHNSRWLVQSSRSKPTAFQAVSFQRGVMTMRRWQSIGGMWAAERYRDSQRARVTDPPSHFVAPPKDSKARQPGILEPALQPATFRRLQPQADFQSQINLPAFSR